MGPFPPGPWPDRPAALLPATSAGNGRRRPRSEHRAAPGGPGRGGRRRSWRGEDLDPEAGQRGLPPARPPRERRGGPARNVGGHGQRGAGQAEPGQDISDEGFDPHRGRVDQVEDAVRLPLDRAGDLPHQCVEGDEVTLRRDLLAKVRQLPQPGRAGVAREKHPVGHAIDGAGPQDGPGAGMGGRQGPGRALCTCIVVDGRRGGGRLFGQPVLVARCTKHRGRGGENEARPRADRVSNRPQPQELPGASKRPVLERHQGTRPALRQSDLGRL
jgi:hypothetical protein